MSIYSKKQRWKIILLILALLIIVASLWYGSSIVNKVRSEEKEKVELWSEAIQKKSELVRYYEVLFKDLREEERKKVELWRDAMKISVNPNVIDIPPITTKILLGNKSIPTIITEADKKTINTYGNLDPSRENDPKYLKEQLNIMKGQYEPLEINEYGIHQYVFYKDSRIITELEEKMDALINSFISETVINSASVPVILTGPNGENVRSFGNVDSLVVNDPAQLQLKLKSMAAENTPIEVDLGEGDLSYIYYAESLVLKQLKFFPLVQFIIIGLFLLIAYLIWSTFRKAEQDQVWVGLAKETAHQLGTPLSSLMAWVQLMEAKDVEPSMVSELNKDVMRLETITDRFSKIGSMPELDKENVFSVLRSTINYLQPRVSSKINFSLNDEDGFDAIAKLNKPLFSWVIENICKNAIDAMNGEGSIEVNVIDEIQVTYIDISDTGKGLPSNLHKRVFQPGFTTKKRGWGLGLSLSKRIIENYHEGKIFVKRSEVGKGTTFRIVLNK
ncbi:MAG: HAMP domain-containing histidine kinase [Flavobacteriales bacterium]|nr:HAMP domain-containing histidine kinase [Flavobacteriales bacterium]